MMRTLARILLPLILLSGLVISSSAQDLKMLLDLRGKWKFNLGDEMRWGTPTLDDRKWDELKVPGAWEDQGYPGYDGYAWYRKHFRVPGEWAGKKLYLDLGYVDDVDEVYLNGQFVAFRGGFPPNYLTAYSTHRQYQILWQYLNPNGDNLLAVRVYDSELAGGIVKGNIGIYEDTGYLQPDLQFPTSWRFTTGDNLAWKEEDVDDSRWESITVPAFWETQGHKDYDGYGWYRLKFQVPSELLGQTLILLAGRIDDLDETYLNGRRIGRTGTITGKERNSFSEEYRQLRAYTIPPGLLQAGQENVLAIRVYDGWLHGGIYDGPLGLVTRDRYLKWEDKHREHPKGIKELFDYIFH